MPPTASLVLSAATVIVLLCASSQARPDGSIDRPHDDSQGSGLWAMTATCPSNCYSCQTSSFCHSCNDGYFNDNGSCVQSCSGSLLQSRGACVCQCPVDQTSTTENGVLKCKTELLTTSSERTVRLYYEIPLGILVALYFIVPWSMFLFTICCFNCYLRYVSSKVIPSKEEVKQKVQYQRRQTIRMLAGFDDEENGDGETVDTLQLRKPGSKSKERSGLSDKKDGLAEKNVKLRLAPSMITFEDVFYTVSRFNFAKMKTVKKDILQGATGFIPSGKITALMGASGGGKSTLLNVLSFRSKGGVIRGNICLNGTPITLDSIRSSGFSHQYDIHFAHLTVRRYLQYCALLRMPNDTTWEQKFRKVEETLDELGIKHVAENKIGDEHHPGISGGQAKRVSIAAELLADPSVLFMDEPTSGLDALSSLNLLKTLQKLAGRGITICATIHQPRSEIWDLLDHLVLLKAGKVIFCGAPSECITVFSSISKKHAAGYTNKADFVTDVICAADDTDAGVMSGFNLSTLYDNTYFGDRTRLTVESVHNHASCMHRVPKRVSKGIGPLMQLMVLTSRFISSISSDVTAGILGRFGQDIGVAILLGSVFFQVEPENQKGMDYMTSSIYFLVQIMLIQPAIANNYHFQHFRVYLREYESRTMNSTAYLMAQWVLSTVLESADVAIIGFLTYWMVGYQQDEDDASMIFYWILITCVGSASVASLWMMLATYFNGEGNTRTLTFSVINMGGMLSGFFIHKDELPFYAYPFYYASITKWTIEGVFDVLINPLSLEFVALFPTCDELQESLDGTTQTSDSSTSSTTCPVGGGTFLDTKGMDHSNYTLSLLILFCYVLIFRFMSTIFIRRYALNYKRKHIVKKTTESFRNLRIVSLDYYFGVVEHFVLMCENIRDKLSAEHKQLETLPKGSSSGLLESLSNNLEASRSKKISLQELKVISKTPSGELHKVAAFSSIKNFLSTPMYQLEDPIPAAPPVQKEFKKLPSKKSRKKFGKKEEEGANDTTSKTTMVRSVSERRMWNDSGRRVRRTSAVNREEARFTTGSYAVAIDNIARARMGAMVGTDADLGSSTSRRLLRKFLRMPLVGASIRLTAKFLAPRLDCTDSDYFRALTINHRLSEDLRTMVENSIRLRWLRLFSLLRFQTHASTNIMQAASRAVFKRKESVANKIVEAGEDQFEIMVEREKSFRDGMLGRLFRTGPRRSTAA